MDLEERLTKIKERMLSSCEKCKGLGYYEDRVCDCLMEFRVWNRLLPFGFQEEYLLLSKDEVLENIEADEVSLKVLDWFFNNFHKVRERGLGLYIWSRRFGLGKTSLATVIAKEYARFCLSDENYVWDFKGAYVDLGTFYEKFAKREEAFLSLWNADIFVLDEFGRDVLHGENVKDWLIVGIERFLRHRISNRLVTIICSNLPVSEIAVHYGEVIASLLGLSSDSDTSFVFRSLELKGIDIRRSALALKRWE